MTMDTQTMRERAERLATEDLLVDYASGAAPAPVALAVATYLELNPSAAGSYRRLNAVGGALLDDLPPAPVNERVLDALLDRLEREPRDLPALPFGDARGSGLPAVLLPYVGGDLSSLPWKSIKSGVEEYVLALDTPGYRTSLLRIAPGKAMPQHSHKGDEITVVIEGAYQDEDGRFCRGDIERASPAITHQPIADPQQGCLCLAVLSAPLRLTGLVGWLVNPFLRN
jgi:putative transcriptional regulator